MDNQQRLKNLAVPEHMVDVILDTYAYNEIDDQFAIAYLLKSNEKLNTKALYAAPFLNSRSASPEDGMEKSYNEINKILKIMGKNAAVFKGSDKFLDSETAPVSSPAAIDLCKRAKNYSPQNPLYIVAIGAITNIASALLLSPEISENIVIVWLGGHARHFHDTREFNMEHDIAAARVVMNSGAPFVQLPCYGVVSHFTISKPELERWFIGKNKLCDYLASSTISEVEKYSKNEFWSRCIWDVAAVAWLLNDNNRFMLSRLERAMLPTYDFQYTNSSSNHVIQYVYYIKRDKLLNDLIVKLTDI